MSMATTVLDSQPRSSAALAVERVHLLILTAVFFITLPLINPLVHGDGVGYYAYLRAPLIQHNFEFQEDWRHANLGFVRGRVNPADQLTPDQFTSTGHVSNLFSPGPAVLWSPFFLVAHSTVLFADRIGSNIPADGFSLPYRVLVAFGTAIYGFFGLLLSYMLAQKYVNASWALLATLSVWIGSSLPVYMYFNPFWSHAHSAFAVALFLWYWDRTGPNRTVVQWLWLGVISGLMLNVYFPNGAFLLIPLVEAIQSYVGELRSKDGVAILRQFGANLIFLVTLGISILPTLLTRKIIFGGMFRFGAYTAYRWDWRAPELVFRSLLFGTRFDQLDSAFGSGPARFIPALGPGAASQSLFSSWRTGFLLCHFKLSLLAWDVLLRKSFFYFFDSCLCFWTGALAGASG